jgi:hypothetical protein
MVPFLYYTYKQVEPQFNENGEFRLEVRLQPACSPLSSAPSSFPSACPGLGGRYVR